MLSVLKEIHVGASARGDAKREQTSTFASLQPMFIAERESLDQLRLPSRSFPTSLKKRRIQVLFQFSRAGVKILSENKW